jgi:hypothetical protein
MHGDFVKFTLFTKTPLVEAGKAETLYEILDHWRFRPSKFNEVEPILKDWKDRHQFLQQFHANCNESFGTLLIKWTKPTFNAMVMWRKGPRAKSHCLSFFQAKPHDLGGEQVPYLLEIADQLFEQLDFDYGFACLNSEYYHSNICKDVQIDERTIQPVQVVGMEWPECIPGLYWCNYFGKAYFEQGFGRRIADLPNTTKLANGIRLMRSDSALDWESPEDRERTQSLMDTLGRDWFFTKETGMPDKALKTDKSLFLKPLSQ